jgi:transcription elongation factor
LNSPVYLLIREHPADGLNYYRIRQVDLDGKHTATNVQQVYVHCNGGDAIKVFPTVSNNTVNVILPKRYEDATVTILTTLGQKVNVPMENTNGHYRINIAPLAAAMYMIHVQKGEEVNTFKIIKEN